MTQREPAPGYVDGEIYAGPNGTWWRCINVDGWIDFVPAEEEGEEDDA